MKYTVYFDAGTTNCRIYLMDGAMNPVFTKKSNVGSRDNVISGDKNALTAGMYALYQEALTRCGIADGDVGAIYASGMVSSAYGLFELTHAELPLSVAEYARQMYPFEETQFFGRPIFLAPGMKKLDANFDYVNNMRGEEMEVLGMLDGIAADFPGQTCAVALPGSHTHVVFVRDGELLGIVSNFTGELFHAVSTETLLAPVLTAEVDELDEEWIRKGVRNLNEFGLSRALYICHAMRVFSEGTSAQRVSYGEGVLLGGIAQSVDHYCEKFYPDCKTVLIAADAAIGGIYRAIFSTCPRFETIEIHTADPQLPFTVLGLRKLLQAGN